MLGTDSHWTHDGLIGPPKTRVITLAETLVVSLHIVTEDRIGTSARMLQDALLDFFGPELSRRRVAEKVEVLAVSRRKQAFLRHWLDNGVPTLGKDLAQLSAISVSVVRATPMRSGFRLRTLVSQKRIRLFFDELK